MKCIKQNCFSSVKSLKNIDCLTSPNGKLYAGPLNVTRNGNECQRWDSQSPNEHKYGGTGDHNFCRNPSQGDTVWCYTTNPDKRWEYCDVRPCGECDL